jgi:murein DD-endopeptidase MepM/ murein hydrolase activator NlpD
MNNARPRALYLGLPAAVAVFVGASSPTIAQRVPRFLFPALAALGAGLLVLSLVRSLARLVEGHRADGRARLFPVIAIAIPTILVAALPAARLSTVLTHPSGGPPLILTGFGAWRGSEGYPRLDPHRGLDIKGPVGADVLAAADGRVTAARDNRDLCGLIVAIAHDPHDYRTVYCHLSVLAVKPGERVTRGQRIGAIGTTGQRAWPGYEHVHLELQRGADLRDIHDPAPRIVGCFDATRAYPTDRLVLTYPVKC